MYVVRSSGSESSQENYKTLEDRKCCESYVSKKIQETIFVFSIPFFSSLCFFSAYYFSFALFTIVRTTKWQSTHINKSTHTHIIMAKSR